MLLQGIPLTGVRSAVLKATIFRKLGVAPQPPCDRADVPLEEVTTAWLVPWYHYIPIDYAYRDLYSILLYFFGLEVPIRNRTMKLPSA